MEAGTLVSESRFMGVGGNPSSLIDLTLSNCGEALMLLTTTALWKQMCVADGATAIGW